MEPPVTGPAEDPARTILLAEDDVVVAAIRRTQPGCRVIAVTGFSAPAIERAFLAGGAARFLTKPVERADLLAALDVKPA